MASKMFHIGDLLSIVEGSLVNPMLPGRSHPIDGVYEILDFMTGESLFTHALPRVGDECRPTLLAEYPWLAEIKFPGIPDGFDVEWKRAEQAKQLAGNNRDKYLSPGEMPLSDEQFGRRGVKPRAQARWMNAIEVHDKARDDYQSKCNSWIAEWLAPFAERYGEYHEVWPLHSEDHESIPPLEEPIIQGLKIIEVDLDDNESPAPEGDINWKDS